MELAEGPRLNRFCDQKRFTIEERIRLFIQICSAVQHAHQRGIIHRDLKPGNILISIVDGEPVPKIIDFGLAKALEGNIADVTQQTNFGQILGTYCYMSPEQSRLDSKEVDTRSDIYSLGAILYQLLTGTTPLDSEEFKGKSALAILDAIRTKEAVRPSLRFQSLDDQRKEVVRLRKTDVTSLGEVLSNDLDWIVLKSLELDPDRRYQSPSELSADLQRCLNHEPVLARPPTTRYRVKKFFRKHRLAAIAGGLVAATLVAGIVGTTLGLIRALDSEREASQRLLQLEKGNEVLANIFDDLNFDSNTASAEPLEAVLAQRLVTAAEQMDGENLGDRLAVAELQTKLGASLLGLGFASESVEVYEKSYQTRLRELGYADRRTRNAAGNYGSALRQAGRLDEAFRVLSENLDYCEHNPNVDESERLDAVNSLGYATYSLGKTQQARVLFRIASKGYRELNGEHDQRYIAASNGLAMSLYDSGEIDEAKDIYDFIFEYRIKELGPDHPLTLLAMSNLGNCLNESGDQRSALEVFVELHERSKRTLGKKHPYAIDSLRLISTLNLDMGELGLAITNLEKVVDVSIEIRGERHPRTLMSINSLGLAYMRANDHRNALHQFEKVFRIRTEALDAGHPAIRVSKNNLATCLSKAGLYERAMALRKELDDEEDGKVGESKSLKYYRLRQFGLDYVSLGDDQLAFEKFHDAAVECERKFGRYARLTVKCRVDQAKCAFRLGRKEQAIVTLGELALSVEASEGRDHLVTQIVIRALGNLKLEAGQNEQAIVLLEESTQARETHASLANAGPDLRRAYRETGQFKKLNDSFAASIVKLRSEFEPSTNELANQLEPVCVELISHEKPKQAESILRECLEIRSTDSSESLDSIYVQMLLGISLSAQDKNDEGMPLIDESERNYRACESSLFPFEQERFEIALEMISSLTKNSN